MACTICNARYVMHGSNTEVGAEYGCHDGVLMDDDEYMEGWDDNQIYPPCRNNPAACPDCKGTSHVLHGPECGDWCPSCEGTGWKDRNIQWPTRASDLEPSP